ncbi:MAG: PD40 domain-containing protein [Bacteroidetes bacterium]|nr:PD40 domain-containing protein [Bacteroidota bacterium]
MIYAEPDKKKCISYLKFACSKPDQAPKEAKFYLGKAYHINYFFDEAIKNYNEFKKTGTASQIKKLQVDREVKACGYGKRLLSNLSDLVIQSKKQLNEADYFRSYDLKNIGGKLLVKPDDFKSSTDKKKKDKSIVYVPQTGSRVYFSSYGDADNRDIYYATKLPNGTFSKPQKVKGINSDQDEDYPFIHPDGNTMYFASKGYNSMGGYDIFKSTYIEATDSWSQPVNLEFPINSPDDDYLYVTDSLEKTAFFSTGRQSVPGKIDVLKISTERKPIDILALKGTVVKENADQSLQSRITVKNMDKGNVVGVYEAEDNGNYLMDLPNGANLLYTVETPGLKTQSERVGLPMVATSKPLKQTISYDKGILKIINNFDETATDDSYLQYLKIIEKKAKLDVNQGENNLSSTLVNNTSGDKQNNAGNSNSSKGDTSVVKTNSTNTNGTAVNKSTSGMDNKQLADMSKKEAEDLAREANILQQDGADAFEVGTQKQIEANKKLKEAEDALKTAEQIANEEEKKNAVEKAIILKKDAESDVFAATKILDYSSNLKEDAAVKIKEADLTKQYSEELYKTINNKNNGKEALEKLDKIQKELDALSGYKNKSENIYTSIKTDVEEKEKQISTVEKQGEDIKTNIDEIKEAITTSEADLAKAKKKEKEAIKTKIEELKTDRTEKEKQYENNITEVKKLKEELSGLNKGLDMANKVKNENIAVITTSVAATNTAVTTPVNPSEKITNKSLSEKYRDKVVVADNSSKENIELSTTELKNYNNEIDAVIAKDKQDLAKTTNATVKQQLSNEIKQLDAAKKQNQQKIAANTKKIDDLTKGVAVNAANKPEQITTINPTDNADAVTKLDNLNNKLTTYDNTNFDYNGYQNAEAQKLKVEADTKINDAVAQQKKLKDLIVTAKEQIKSGSGGATVTPQQLYKEAEEYSLKAFDLRSKAATLNGAEKDAALAQAKEEEVKANEKNLQASDIIKNDNKSVFDTEAENIKLLINDNKASEGDLTEAKKLQDDAVLAFKQAASMREEANSLSNAGARLGNLSNAEDKEAEALLKEKQAIDLLKTTSPGITLKKAATSADNKAGTLGSNNLNDQLVSVNNSVTDLLASKANAYEKLYEANKIELDQLTGELKSNQSVIDKTPAFKSDWISANNKIAAAQNSKLNTEATTDNNKKITDLAEITKKQIEALNQLNSLNKKITTSIAANTARNNNTANNSNGNTNSNTGNNTANNNNNNNNNNNGTTVATSTVSNNTNATKTNTVNNTVNNQTTIATNTVSAGNNNGNEVTTNTVSNTNNATSNGNEVTTSTNVANNTSASSTTVDLTSLAKKDTSAAEVVNLFESKKVTMKNQQANALISKSIAELKNIENENKALENEIKNAGGNTSGENPAQLKTRSDNLLTEAEDLSVKSFDLKTLANSKTGEEKDKLLAQSKDLEAQANTKKLEAVQLTEKANEVTYNTNSTAIKELLEKLKAEDPDLSSQLSEKGNEVTSLKTKSQKLREEASSQPNTSAKVGAMMNAEEQEAEMLQKQTEIFNELKKRYPDYVVKENTNTAVPENLKQKQTQIAERQNEQLTNLTNAFSLEYETTKNTVPAKLTNDQKATKQNADDLNAESKRLLIQSVNEKNQNEKVKLLTLSAKTANSAVELLNTLPKTAGAVANTNPDNRNNINGNTNSNVNNNANAGNNNNTTANNTNRNNTTNNNTGNTNPRNNTAGNNNANVTGKGTIKVEGLEVTTGNAYNAAKPIPVDAKVPDGLIFRVQIGAFKVKLPDNSFQGLTPVNAETTPTGYLRYTAGNFNKLENANAVKNDLINLGYSDAFVVGFYNGKRISLNEALDILAKEGKVVDNNAAQTAGISANANIPKATANPVNANINNQDAVAVTKELEQMNGLLYTVQIGVYNKQVNKGKLYNLRPIYTEKLPNGLYRYTAGIYNNTNKLVTDKSRVVDLGIRDAFVSAYINGKRVSFAEGKQKQQDTTTKMEPENPIVFTDASAPVNNTAANVTPLNNSTSNNTTVQPFSNGVTAYPAATPENGIKTTEQGISFKVQIGAYSKQVPNDVAAKFSSIKTWPVENKQINGLFIYNIGNFSDAKFAKTLRTEAVAAGIADAFITVYKDGKKLYGPEAAQYLNR